MVVVLKNSMRTPQIYLRVTWAKKNVTFFFFTHSHSHCVSLYFFTRIAPLKMAEYLFVFLLTLELTHTGRIWLSLFLFFASALHKAEWPFLPSFLFLHPTRFATLLNKRSQSKLFASLNFLSSFNMLDMLQSSLIKRHGCLELEDFWNHTHKWALPWRHVGSKWAGLQGCHVHPTL